MSLERQLRLGRQIRSIGFDDSPFDKSSSARVAIGGVVCADTRFEGLLWGELGRDGLDATEVLLRLLLSSKFLPQLHLVLLDGIAFGGFNVVELERLASTLGRPCVAVMRKAPQLERVLAALARLPDAALRIARLQTAGPIHQDAELFFQVQGATADTAAAALRRLCDRGKVPEPLRLAHLIGSAVLTGQSSKRA